MYELKLNTSQQVFLVVYAVLWAGVLPTFGRLRVFAVNDLRRRHARGRTLQRFAMGVFFANVLPGALLVGLLLFLRDVDGNLGLVVAVFLGLWPVVFPRLLHALVASNRWWARYYGHAEWRGVVHEWDPLPGAHLDNTRTAHFVSALLVSLVPGAALLVGAVWA